MHVHVEDKPTKPSPIKSNKQRNIMIILVVAAVICVGAGAFVLLTPAQAPVVVGTDPKLPHYNINLSYDFGILPAAYNQHLIKITHDGGETVENMSSDLWITIYPPDGTPYAKRSAVVHISKYLSFEPGDRLYVYLGKDQLFYASKELPDYDSFIDFPDGDWSIHVDDARYKSGISNFSFTVENSKTHLISKKTTLSINEIIAQSQPYDSIFIMGDQIYHEQVLMESNTVRLYGIGNPTIDAGGMGSTITISNCSYGEIFGFNIQNSGTSDFTKSGILLKGSNHMSIKNNSIRNNQNGIFLQSSDNNDIRYNYVQSNDISGIVLGYGSSTNTVKDNYFGYNTIGIYIKDSSNSNYVVNNNGGYNSRYGILIENKLNNMYEYNNFGADVMSYEQTGNVPVTYYSVDKGTNDTAWLDPNRTVGLHESTGGT